MKAQAMSKETTESWERFLDPAILRTNLITTSIYIAAYELLSDAIVDRIRDFFFRGFDEAGAIITDTKYQVDVLSKNRSPVYASLQWLKESKAIDDSDMASFEQVKKCRNMIAHEMIRMAAEGLPSEWSDRFKDMVTLLDKIEKWWIINFEIPINSDFDGQEIDANEIVPGRIAGLRMMLDIALGSETESQQYLAEFKKKYGGA
jgi:hypothetical protein